MSTPNPLIPQGTFQAQAARGASNVRFAVATIVAIHIVFFGGLLLQGCKRDPETSVATNVDTNASTVTNLSLGPVDTSSLYYSTGNLPAEAGATLPPDSSPYSQYGNTSSLGAVPSAPTNTPEALWQNDNLGSPVTGAGTLETTDVNAQPMKEYTIARGDTLGAIAKRNKITLSALRDANPGVDPLKIRPGQKLQIPAPTVNANSNAAVPGASVEGNGTVYTVKSGDTLSKIASRNGITVSQLRAANDLPTSRINVGQKLKIPARTNGAPAAAPNQNQGPIL